MSNGYKDTIEVSKKVSNRYKDAMEVSQGCLITLHYISHFMVHVMSNGYKDTTEVSNGYKDTVNM